MNFNVLNRLYKVILMLNAFGLTFLVNAQINTPTSIPELKLWLKADAGIVIDAGAVSQWEDQSGNNFHATQSIEANRPTLINSTELNNLPALQFDGVNDFLSGIEIPNLNNQSLTIFIVANGRSQSSTNAVLFSVNNTTSGFTITRRASAQRIGSILTGNLIQGSVSLLPTSGYGFRIFGYQKNLSSSANLRINGIQEVSSSSASLTGTFTNTIYQIGAAVGSNPYNGDISEIIIYTKSLSAIERQSIEMYLMNKYAPPIDLGVDINSEFGFCDLTLVPQGYFNSYLWSTGETTSSISINEPGSYWVQGTDIFGRVSRDTIQVTRPVYDSIQLNNQIICFNEPLNTTAFVPSGNYTFVQWSDGETNPVRILTAATSLSYTVVDNQNCTRTSNTASFTIDSSFSSYSLGIDLSLCLGNTLEAGTVPSNTSTYLWSTGATTSQIAINSSGEYWLELTNQNTCSIRDTININIIGEAPTVQFNFPSTFCQNEIISYSESSFVPSGENVSAVFWDFGNNQNSSSSNGTFNNTTSGNYSGSLTVTSEGGCSNTSPFNYQVKNKPIAQATFSPTCVGFPFTVASTSQSQANAIISYEWLLNDLSIGSSPQQVINNANATQNITLIVQNNHQCSDTLTFTVNAPISLPLASEVDLLNPGIGATLLNGLSTEYSWTPVPGATSYRLQVASDISMTTLLKDTIVSTSFVNLELTGSGQRFWRVQSRNACETGLWSATNSFLLADPIEGMKLHLSADFGVELVDGKVVNWQNRASNLNHVNQNVITSRPQYVSNVSNLNGKPTLRFDGVDDFLFGDSIAGVGNKSHQLFVLSNGRAQSSTNGIMFCINNGTNGYHFTRRASAQRLGTVHNNTLLQGATTTLSSNGYDYRLFGMGKNIGVSVNLRINGALEISGNTISMQNVIVNGDIGIGATPIGGSPINGDISEVLFFDRILSTTERQTVEKSIMDKYAPSINLGSDINIVYGFCDTTISPYGFFTSYLWSTGATTSSISINEPGSYWVQGTDIFGRVSRDTVNIERPIYQQVSLPQLITCYNENLNFSANVPNGHYSFQTWNDGFQSETRLLEPNQLLNYSISDTNGCVLISNSVTVFVDSSLIDFSLGLDKQLCIGNQLSPEFIPSIFHNYLWNNGQTDYSILVQTTGDYWLEISNSNNCRNRDSIFIEILGFAPDINYNFPSNVCQFDEVQFSESSTVQESNIAATYWTINNQAPIFASSGQIIFDQTGSIPVFLEVVSSENCRSSVEFEVIVNPKPILSFSTQNYCPYESINFSPSNQINTEITSYDWNFGQPSSPTNSSSISNPSHNYGVAGNYFVNLKVVDANGCKDTVIQTVVVQPAPIANFTVQNTCEKTTVEFINTSSIPSGYTISSMLWSYGDNTSAINPTTDKKYNEYGDYIIELIAVGNNGCADTTTNSITIYPNPVLNWSISPSCKNTLTVFEDLSTIPEGTLVSTDWLVNLQFPFTTPIASYRFGTLGVQYLNLTSTSDKNCTSDTLIILNVNPELDARFNYSPSNVVAGVPITFFDLSIGSTSSTWDLGKGEQFINYTPPVNQFSSTYNTDWVDSIVIVSLFVENQIGCKDTMAKSFVVNRQAFDLEVSNLFVQEANGFNTIGVGFKNKGSLDIKKVEFVLTSLNSLPIQETWNGNLQPNQQLIYIFNSKLSAYNSTQDDFTNFLCVEGVPFDNLGSQDLFLLNNKLCQNLENEEFVLMSLFPNPTENLTQVNLLIPSSSSDEANKLNVSLYNLNGEITQQIFKDRVVEPGIFDFTIDFQNIARGIYLLKIEHGSTTKLVRVAKI